MLKNVYLKNLALINEAEIDLAGGLNILTGETGSGKSIIITAINMALGQKADKGLIGNCAKSGLVELVFSDICENAKNFLTENDFGADDSLIISRKISDGGSVNKINGHAATLSQIKALTSVLIDIHGQHDHQSLLDSANHVKILDDFAGKGVTSLKKKIIDAYNEFVKTREELSSFSMDSEALEREKAFLEHEINEIESASLKDGEDALLEDEFKRLSSSRQIAQYLNSVKAALANDSGAGELFSLSLQKLKEAKEVFKGEELLALESQLFEIDSLLKDFNHDLSSFESKNSFSEERFQEVRARLDEINSLKSKYGNTILDILNYALSCTGKLDSYSNYEKTRTELLSRLRGGKSKLNSLAKELSAKRKEAALALEKSVSKNLEDLNFLNIDFKINIEKADKITRNGFDKVEFLI